MLVARQTFLRQAVASLDVLTLLYAITLSYRLLGPALKGGTGAFADYFWMLWVIAPVWLVSFWSAGLYRSRRYQRVISLIACVVQAQIVAALLLFGSMYMTKPADVSRVLMKQFVAISFFALLAQKLTLHT